VTDTDAAPRTDDDVPASDAGAGRRILLGVGLAVVAVAGLIGYVVGTNNAGRTATTELFGVVAVPVTGPWLGLAGVVLASLAVGTLFALVELVSRLE
jgi:hypothetical protein